MKWAALSVDGKTVENIIAAEQSFIDSQAARAFVLLSDGSPVVQIGDIYDGKGFSSPIVDITVEKKTLIQLAADKASVVKDLSDGTLQLALNSATTPEEIETIKARLAALG